MHPEQVSRVRRFNRLVTQRIGALHERFLGRDRSLGESRVLHEIGPEGADLRDVRARLGLDSGYLSRLVRSLTDKGLIRVQPLAEDRRVRRAELTAAGLAEYHAQDRLSDEGAAALLAPLSDAQRARLLAAMAEVETLLRAAGVRIERVHPAEPAARGCVARYFEELDARFERGFDPGASLPADDAELVPPRGAFLVATVDGEAVACGAVKGIGGGVGSIKRMWVAESARGLGVGRRMLDALEAEARALGIMRLRLETNRALTEAIALYRGAGYREVAAFNDDPYAHHWFEKELGPEVSPPTA
ncbi:MAG TPA: bifunctional helix-turn-helix transcriptional regulator/GNAT family N-acetyltransferase [Longimicrobium sp.]|nr:bifunctional helix-turn-helix transcriptional regulator/GNAT family N-acetyltransferase [Longimicrobium sp.]